MLVLVTCKGGTAAVVVQGTSTRTAVRPRSVPHTIQVQVKQVQYDYVLRGQLLYVVLILIVYRTQYEHYKVKAV